jgi:hypothetical protein
MDVWYDIVEKSKKKKRIRIIIYSSILVPLASIPFAPDCPGVCPYSIFMATSMLVWSIIMFAMIFFYTIYKRIGMIRFQDESVKVLDQSYALESIKKVEINFNSYEGQSIGRYPSEGCDNQVTIYLKTGSSIRVFINIPDRRHSNIIPKFLNYYKNKGVEVLLNVKNQ